VFHRTITAFSTRLFSPLTSDNLQHRIICIHSLANSFRDIIENFATGLFMPDGVRQT
jgi:hypothetical protein